MQYPESVQSHHWISGIPVVVDNSRADIDTNFVIARLQAALALIGRYLPARLRRMRHDFAQIAVRRFPCRAAYFPDTRTCLVELTFLANRDFSPAQIAASIVHEGVHARLDRMGIHSQDRSREERLCRKAEIELGLAVPDGGPVLERARQAAMLDDEGVAPTIDWAEAERRVRQVDREAGA